MGPSDDAAAQRDLNATLERFRGDARVALGLRATDDAGAARKAFMALAKVYHPAKFARFAPQTVKLANEVFLSIRRAYESISSAPAPVRAAAGSTAPPERSSGGIPRIVKFTPPTGVPITPPPPPAPAPPRAVTASPTPNPQLEKALELTQQKRWAEARTAFVELATKNPGDPRYRAYVHYARGWEALTLGKDNEARAEWQRALALDPRNDLVKVALESTSKGK
ncbi:MAG TPA: tetratricopeptide repeat protein [Kofleriaceae bacterium]|nr:tetratricopeptide repeat protein [Kofleriaceae bacterium]